ncbi:protein LURP-one-related 8-like [Lolium rigidum]|uniref:protein LURP-one-related 8-like n=1 Tax=Lolium rigidum TaxID=89674 RepID=UPI001F5D052A|nr:protein LURP-one-related 8-like [Lolium rigidum]
MSRIHPNAEASRRRLLLRDAPGGAAESADSASAAACYTVWMRSSMGFQGTDGFSVYDAGGALAFRVDNYSRRRKIFAGELTLMDGHGAPLLSLRPQIISMHDQWNCYKVPEEGQAKRARSQQLFSMRKCSVLQGNREAEVYMSSPACSTTATTTTTSPASDPAPPPGPQAPSFWIEGCFRRRSCKIRRGVDGQEVARIARKKAGPGKAPLTLGDDVFSLVVQPDVDCAVIMALVVVLDRICWRPYTPLICSS